MTTKGTFVDKENQQKSLISITNFLRNKKVYSIRYYVNRYYVNMKKTETALKSVTYYYCALMFTILQDSS